MLDTYIFSENIVVNWSFKCVLVYRYASAFVLLI